MSWISVDKELPETFETEGNYHASKECIVICAGSYELALFQIGPDGGGWANWYSHFYEDTLENVTDWMPLPAPPLDWETEDSGAYTSGKYWVYEMNGQWMLDERDLMAPDGFISLDVYDTEEAAKEAAERLEGAQ